MPRPVVMNVKHDKLTGPKRIDCLWTVRKLEVEAPDEITITARTPVAIKAQ